MLTEEQIRKLSEKEQQILICGRSPPRAAVASVDDNDSHVPPWLRGKRGPRGLHGWLTASPRARVEGSAAPPTFVAEASVPQVEGLSWNDGDRRYVVAEPAATIRKHGAEAAHMYDVMPLKLPRDPSTWNAGDRLLARLAAECDYANVDAGTKRVLAEVRASREVLTGTTGNWRWTFSRDPR